MARLNASRPDLVVTVEVKGMEMANVTSSRGRKDPPVQLLRGLVVETTVATITNPVMEDPPRHGLQVAVEAMIMEATVTSQVDMVLLPEVPPLGSDNKMRHLHPLPADRTTDTVAIQVAMVVMEANQTWELLLALEVAQAVWVLLPVWLRCMEAMVLMDPTELHLHHPEKLLPHQ